MSDSVYVDSEIQAAIDKVLEGFDQGIFQRNVSGDDTPGWAIKLLPYISALSVLARLRGPAAVSEAPQEALAALVAEIDRLVAKYRSQFDTQNVGWLPLSQFAPVFEKLAVLARRRGAPPAP